MFLICLQMVHGTLVTEITNVHFIYPSESVEYLDFDKCIEHHWLSRRAAMAFWTSAWPRWSGCIVTTSTPSFCCSSFVTTSRSERCVSRIIPQLNGYPRRRQRRCMNWLLRWNRSTSMSFQVSIGTVGKVELSMREREKKNAAAEYGEGK